MKIPTVLIAKRAALVAIVLIAIHLASGLFTQTVDPQLRTEMTLRSVNSDGAGATEIRTYEVVRHYVMPAVGLIGAIFVLAPLFRKPTTN